MFNFNDETNVLKFLNANLMFQAVFDGAFFYF